MPKHCIKSSKKQSTKSKHEYDHCAHQQKFKYATFNYPSATVGGKTLLTGIRGITNTCDKEIVAITGFYEPGPNDADQQVKSFVYKGDIKGQGTFFLLNFPESLVTNLYGPSFYKDNNNISVVGNYTTPAEPTIARGCLYRGPFDGSGTWITLAPPVEAGDELQDTIAHSNMCNLAVGNYNTVNEPKKARAFIYDILTGEYTEIIKEHATSITAYGIWHNANCHGSNSIYTICGGFTNFNIVDGFSAAYLVDWDNETKTFFNWQNFHYNNDPLTSVITHFDGISGAGPYSYNLTGDWAGLDAPSQELGFFAHVKRKKCKNGKFSRKASWAPVSFPGERTITSGNSVFKNIVIGVYTNFDDEGTVNGYTAVLKK